jgi:hypothetical protein
MLALKLGIGIDVETAGIGIPAKGMFGASRTGRRPLVPVLDWFRHGHFGHPGTGLSE